MNCDYFRNYLQLKFLGNKGEQKYRNNVCDLFRAEHLNSGNYFD